MGWSGDLEELTLDGIGLDWEPRGMHFPGMGGSYGWKHDFLGKGS